MSDVFISYSRKDKDFVKVLHQVLTASQYNAWVDWEDIPLTADWWEEIKAGIERADTFLFVISPDSIHSNVCNQELDHAIANHKRLIPIVRRDGFDSTLMRSALGKHNWLFFRDEDDFDSAFQSLVKTLDTDLDHVKRHTRLLVKAIEWEHQHHNPDLLMRGSELEHTIQWLTQSTSKEPRSTELQLAYVNESRKAELAQRDAEIRRQKKARKAIATALVGAVFSLVIAIGLGLFAFNRYQAAAVNEINAISTSSDALYVSNRGLNALVEALKGVGQLKAAPWAGNNTRNQLRLALQQAVYDVREQNQIEGHTSLVRSVSFSPDGKVIASASEDGTVRLWNGDGQLLKILRDNGSPIRAMSFSPDGNLIAFGGNEPTLHIWNKDGPLLKINTEYYNLINRIRFSPDGKTIAAVSADGTITLWDLHGKELQRFKGDSDYISDLCFSPDGKLLISGGASNGNETITLWTLNGQELKTFTGVEGEIRSISISPDGKTIASGATNETMTLWNLDGQRLKTLSGHTNWVNSVSFSPDGQAIASGSSDKTIKLWNLNGQELATLEGHSSWVRSVSFSPDGKTIASGSEDGTVKLWSMTSQVLKTFEGHNKWVRSVSFSPDGKVIASGSTDKTVKLWNTTGQILKTFNGHQSRVESVSFSPDGKTIASGSSDANIHLWSADGQLLKTLSGHTDRVNNVSFSPDGKFLASASNDKTVNLWSADGRLLKTFEGHSLLVNSISFSPDSKAIASASDDTTIKLWNLDGRELKTLRGHRDWVYSVSFSPDGKTLASGSGDKTIKLWSVDGHLLNTLTGHHSTVRSVSFSPDGQTILSTSEDNTIKVWSITGQELKTLRGHRNQVFSAGFSPDGKTIISGSDDKTIKLWNAETLNFDQLATCGCDWLQPYLITHPQTLKDLVPCQNKTILAQAAPTLVAQGETLAQQGDVREAIRLFQTALKWNPDLELNPDEKAQQFAAKGQAEILVSEAEALAREDHISEAIAKFQQAQALDPDLNIDSRSKALQTSANASLERGNRFLHQGKIKEAIAAYNKAQQQDATTISADFWNNLCWQGSLHGYATDVMNACEKAVVLAPDDGNIRDSRGLARALTGNTKGAIEDFQFFVDKTNDEQTKSQRQRWIDTLRRGENPFTVDEIKTLLDS